MHPFTDNKHHVYYKSNWAFNKSLNKAFNLLAMKRDKSPIDRALELARNRGMNQSDFAKALDVLPQHVTNWKRRGLPPEYYQRASDVLRCTVDELLGRTTAVSGVREAGPQWPFPVPFSDYESLSITQKRELTEILEDRMNRFKSSHRSLATPKKKPQTRN